MILVLAGTADGREIVRRLAGCGYRVAVSVVTEYGARLAERENVTVLTGALDERSLPKAIADWQIKLIVDATHPYADKISPVARQVAADCGIGYLRYWRPEAAIPANEHVYRAGSYGEAAQMAMDLADTIFLTIGSKRISIFAKAASKSGKRLIARVLPDLDSVRSCLECGLSPGDIIAMQGPFSKELNLAMLRERGAGVLVTKDSGLAGGVNAKIEAARELGIPVVVIKRPEEPGENYTDIDRLLVGVAKALGGERRISDE